MVDFLRHIRQDFVTVRRGPSHTLQHWVGLRHGICLIVIKGDLAEVCALLRVILVTCSCSAVMLGRDVYT